MISVQKKIQNYMKARNWDKLPPADLAKSISIESAELLEHFQWQNWTVEDVKKDKNKFIEIQGEIADVVIYCIEMCNVLNLDLEDVVVDKLRKAEKKYPAKLFKNNTEAHGTGLYAKIKAEYRKNKK